MPEEIITKQRIASIDIVRGLVMVVMALDHTRDFFHVNANLFDPTDLAKTSPLLFLTRWITHYCAPTFVFLSGVSISMGQQRRTNKELSIFLLSRGLWLVFLEFTVIRFGIFFNLYYDVLLFQVIWAIGISMVFLAALIHLPFKAVLITGFLITFGHDLLHLVRVEDGNPFYIPFSLIHQGGFPAIAPGHNLMIPYPFLPWLGIMILGFCLGQWYSKDFNSERRRILLLRAGLLAITLFIVLRLANLYGDISPWTVQRNVTFTILSIINTTKYPPSLMYTLMTIGPVLLLLSVLDKTRPTVSNPFVVFGRVPLFYYVFHFYLIHTVSVVLYLISTGQSLGQMDFHFPKTFGGIPAGYGYSLAIVYVVWISVVLFLYPLCRRYDQYKRTHSHWWLSYI